MANVRWVCALGALVFTSVSAHATEILLHNDDLSPNDPMTGFEPGYRVGVRLTAPVNGTIVGVQIAWGSEDGVAPPTQEVAIRVSEEGVGFSPGATLATIASPVLIDGIDNEFRFLDPGTNLTPLAVPAMAGSIYFVELEFASDTSVGVESALPNVLADAAPNPNTMFTNLGYAPQFGEWFPLAIANFEWGDPGIRLIVQPVPEPSAVALALMGLASLVLCRRRRA